MRRISTTALLCALALSACGGTQQAVVPTAQPVTVLTAPASDQADLSTVKAYLLHKNSELKTATTELKQASDRYYTLAEATNFDYSALWQNQRSAATSAINAARAAWVKASPLYEQMEGIVAGTPSLAPFDVTIDAGSAAAQGGDTIVTFDLNLADGRTLQKPGNLFGVTESALWGTEAAYTAKTVVADFDGNGVVDLGDALPDAHVLKSGVDKLDTTVSELGSASSAWQPTEAEAFGALVGNVPTVTDFVDAWKSSRFVSGDAGSKDFVAISRLSDIVDNITSWQTIYTGISPAVSSADPASDAQIRQGLDAMKLFISDIHAREQAGKRYTPEDADLISAEAQNRATAITGQIAQAAAKLNVRIEE